MRNAIPTCKLHQKQFSDVLGSMSGKYSRWALWNDFVSMTALSIANAFGGSQYETRENAYRNIAKKYTPEELQLFVKLQEIMLDAINQEPEQDFLGELFMSLGLNNEWDGQFFTPYSICRMMASMSANNILEKVQEHGFASVNDPACGAGALLIAFAAECKRQHINYQTDVLFVAQDISQLAALMCYIQLSFLGCAGYVIVGDSLSEPCTCYDSRGLLPTDETNIWYTPMFFRDVWRERRKVARALCLTEKQ